LSIIVLCFSLEAFAQKPTITSVDRENAATREIVTIKGSDFGTNPNNLKVFFGAAAAEIKEISNELLEVRTPSGASYDNVSVTNTTTGLTGYSSDQFYLKFSGEAGLAAANFASQADFQAELGLYDLCACDFDGDGKVDIASVGRGSNSLSF